MTRTRSDVGVGVVVDDDGVVAVGYVAVAVVVAATRPVAVVQTAVSNVVVSVGVGSSACTRVVDVQGTAAFDVAGMR